jgi:DNA-binding NarL/FixJ family response regulator
MRTSSENDVVNASQATLPIRVLAIIPSTMVQEALKAAPLAEGQGLKVAWFDEYSDGATQAFRGAPDVVIVASFLRRPETFAATVKAVQAKASGAAIIAVCPFRSREEVLGAMALGVAGCVCAEVGLDKLREAIMTVRYRTYLCPRASALLREAPRDGVGERPLGDATDLTPRERQILRMIADGSTDRQVAKLLRLSVRTVNTHRANMMAKLGVHNATQLVRRATQLGLLELGS